MAQKPPKSRSDQDEKFQKQELKFSFFVQNKSLRDLKTSFSDVF